MKQIKTILLLAIGIIIGGVIGIKASELIESSQVIYKDNKTVDVALNNLFDELKVGKDKIAEAITNKGINTTSDNTLEEMANNIGSITGDPVVKYLGTGTQFDIATVSSEIGVDYSTLTEDNFIVSAISASSASTGYTSWLNNHIATTSGFNISKTYDASTGTLTISGTSQTVKCTSKAGSSYTISTTQTLQVGVWLIIQ